MKQNHRQFDLGEEREQRTQALDEDDDRPIINETNSVKNNLFKEFSVAECDQNPTTQPRNRPDHPKHLNDNN